MKSYLIILIGALAFSCNSGKQKNNTASGDTSIAKTDVPSQDRAADSAAIRSTIIDFYDWYNKNYTKLMDFHLYEGTKKKDQPPYRINWPVADKYQQYIHDSIPWLGETFLQNQKKFFQECDSAFKAYPDDELPYGFDYDWYTNSQEDPVYTLDMIKQAASWRILWNGDDANVAIYTIQDYDGKKKEMSFLTLQLKKENNNWKIARIGNEE